MLWSKLKSIGISDDFVQVAQSLYNNVQSSVRVNGLRTDFFDVISGLKQGCLLSPILLNLFLDDFSKSLDMSNIGVKLDDTILNHLLYADDLVLIAESEQDLQILLNQIQ